MNKNFQEIEDVLSDDDYQAWYKGKERSGSTAWEKWLEQNPQYHSLVEEANEFMDQLPPLSAASNHETEQQLSQLRRKLAPEEAPVIQLKSRRNRWWMSAAAAILLVAGGFTFWKLNQPDTRLNTTFGQVSSNQLPDGSTMILNANSTAKLSDGWSDGRDREVWLEGEAYFKVTKTAQKSRFIVHTNNLDVIVTGTQFNVQHRNNKTTVLLTEGSVLIQTADGKELAMKPGDYIEMDDMLVQRKQAKEENVLAWKDKKIAFDATPMKEVASTISNHYGVKITLADDEIANMKVTGIMSNNDLDDLLEALQLLKVKVTRKEETIIFSADK